MRRFLTVIAAAAALAAPALAQGTPPASSVAPAGAYVADKPHTTIQWAGLHNGLSWYSARFTSFDIQLTFDPNDVTKSKVTATIDPKSIETDYAKTRPAGNTTDFNSELATGDRYFNAGKFPQITFASTAVTKTSANTGKMTGNLTFLGVTKPVTLDVTYVGNRNDPRANKHKVGFQLKGSFKRSDWGMPIGGPMGDEIRIEINSELVQK
ncbi:MAG: YceI family protein [Hyphomonadaceae bacterium]